MNNDGDQIKELLSLQNSALSLFGGGGLYVKSKFVARTIFQLR